MKNRSPICHATDSQPDVRIGSLLRTLAREFPGSRLPELETALKTNVTNTGSATTTATRLDAARMLLAAWHRNQR